MRKKKRNKNHSLNENNENSKREVNRYAHGSMNIYNVRVALIIRRIE